MIRKVIFLWLCLIVSSLAEAAICTNTEINNLITAAPSGVTTTITLTSPCNVTWAADVVIPSTKGIILDGNGATINGNIDLTPHSTAASRITGFTFTKTSSYAIYVNSNALTSARWRVDHNTFSGSGSFLFGFKFSPGLVDHNTWPNGGSADEQIHADGWGAGVTTGWSTDMPSTGSLASGTDEAVYFEDNTFTGNPSGSNNSWFEGFYGMRVVFRYNTLNYWRLDAHGSDVGSRWWEFYKNDFHQESVSNPSGDYLNLRDGSGIGFSNTYSGNQGSSASIGLCRETGSPASYPMDYQIGRGTNQTKAPAYFWSNQMAIAVDECEAAEVVGMVAFNRDVYTAENSADCTAGGACNAGVGIGTTLPTTCVQYTGFWKTDAGGNWDTTHGGANDGALYKCTSTNTWTLYYTPYTYPHPLQGGGSDTTVPTSGASGAITFAGVTSSAITVNWTKGTDDTSAQGALQYEVCRSASSIGSAGTCESNIVMTFTTDVATYADSGLSSSTTYHYNVVVKDEAGNKTLYVDNSQATSAPSAAANSRGFRR